jgi:hypothetical protein
LDETWKITKRNRWAKLFAKRRNWLLIWRMRGKGVNVAQLAHTCQCNESSIRSLVNHPGKVPSASLMKSLCEALEANPCELGWTQRDMTVTPFFMVDVTAFMRMLDIMLQGFIYTSEILIGMRKKLDVVYMDYMDRMAADGESLDKDTAEFLESGEMLDEVLSDELDQDDW